ncbi:MAG: hypothetical protein GC181_01595 [Bacteroidetes bacterium]|nr:hypothetical protein [Bacteroidota bacterium]
MNNWNLLRKESRIWLYGANRRFTSSELSYIQDLLEDFCSSWAAHGKKLDCGFKIIGDQIIALAVDEAVEAASGCSIDSSVAVIREIDNKYRLDIFNRLRTYVSVGENSLETLSLDDVKRKLASAELHSYSPVVNMQASEIRQIRENPFIPLKNTWLERFIERQTA